MTTYIYRLVVDIPEEYQRPGWQPENWEYATDPLDSGPYYEPAVFQWPNRRLYLSKSGAEGRAKTLRSWGATVSIERSDPVTWPDA